jgi:hypothetical protein
MVSTGLETLGLHESTLMCTFKGFKASAPYLHPTDVDPSRSDPTVGICSPPLYAPFEWLDVEFDGPDLSSCI